MGRLHKGQEVEIHRAVRVGQGDGAHPAVIDGGQVDTAALHQPPAEGHALRRVVVAADEKDLEVPFGQPHQEVIQQSHRFRGRHRLVIDVPGNQDPVWLLLVHDV